nr:unnamed protein product [Callosobruchus chinensis]
MRLQCRCGSIGIDGSKRPHRERTAPQWNRTQMCIV